MIVRPLIYSLLFAIGVAVPLSISFTWIPEHVLAEREGFVIRSKRKTVKDASLSVPVPKVEEPLVHSPRAPELPNEDFGIVGDKEACLEGKRYQDKPRIDLHDVSSVGLGVRYRVRGTIEGVCLSEAGYFEHGKKKLALPVTTSREFSRFDFEVQIDKNERPEIRAYTITGQRAVVEVDPRRHRRSSQNPLTSGSR